MSAANFPEPTQRTATLQQFAARSDSQGLQFLVDAVTIHANRGGADTIYWAVVSRAPQRSRRSARRKSKGADAFRSA
jgi:hypothetical protein